MTDDRAELVELVARLVNAQYEAESDLDRDIENFQSRVPHPRAAGLIYHWTEDFDNEPSPSEIVDRALEYRPIDL